MATGCGAANGKVNSSILKQTSVQSAQNARQSAINTAAKKVQQKTVQYAQNARQSAINDAAKNVQRANNLKTAQNARNDEIQKAATKTQALNKINKDLMSTTIEELPNSNLYTAQNARNDAIQEAANNIQKARALAIGNDMINRINDAATDNMGKLMGEAGNLALDSLNPLSPLVKPVKDSAKAYVKYSSEIMDFVNGNETPTSTPASTTSTTQNTPYENTRAGKVDAYTQQQQANIISEKTNQQQVGGYKIVSGGKYSETDGDWTNLGDKKVKYIRTYEKQYKIIYDRNGQVIKKEEIDPKFITKKIADSKPIRKDPSPTPTPNDDPKKKPAEEKKNDEKSNETPQEEQNPDTGTESETGSSSGSGSGSETESGTGTGGSSSASSASAITGGTEGSQESITPTSGGISSTGETISVSLSAINDIIGYLNKALERMNGSNAKIGTILTNLREQWQGADADAYIAKVQETLPMYATAAEALEYLKNQYMTVQTKLEEVQQSNNASIQSA